MRLVGVETVLHALASTITQLVAEVGDIADGLAQGASPEFFKDRLPTLLELLAVVTGIRDALPPLRDLAAEQPLPPEDPA